MRQSALSYATWLLSRRGRSVYELRQKLLDKKYELEEIEQTLASLQRISFLDDERFAELYTKDKSTIYRRGPRRIFLELIQKGVDKDTAAQAVKMVTLEDELQAAESLLKGKERQWRNLDPLAKKRRALGLLSRRGFSPKVVSQLLKSI